MIAAFRFTSEMDDKLIEMWSNHTIRELSTALGVSRYRVNVRGRELGLNKTLLAPLLAPTDQEWIDIATQKAREARVRPSDLMAGSRLPKVIAARWAAWQAIMALNPRYSLAGVGRTTGFDHTSIRHALLRAGGASAASLRSGRAPTRKCVDTLAEAQEGA